MPAAPLDTVGRPFTRADLAAMPDDGPLIAWQLPGDGGYRQVADVRGDAVFAASVPFPVRVPPTGLVCWPPVT